MGKPTVQEGPAACTSPDSVLQNDGQASWELPPAVKQNEDGSDQRSSHEQPAALPRIASSATGVDSGSGTGTELKAAARVLQEAFAVESQQQPMVPACMSPHLDVSAAASTLQNLSAAQPEEHEQMLQQSTGDPNTVGPSQPAAAPHPQPAYEEGGATPETIAAVNERYHLNTPYEVAFPLQDIHSKTEKT